MVRAARPTMSRPSMRTVPEDTASNPAMTRRSVVLPQPEGPEEREELPLRDLQVHRAQRVDALEALVHAAAER